MHRALVTRLANATLAVLIFSSAFADAPAERAAGQRTLRAFASEQELDALFKRWASEAQRRRDEQGARRAQASELASGQVPPPPVPAAAAPAAAAKTAAEAKTESVTNVQHAGVDEGGIVKVHGEHLVILRRGRLFTVRVGGNELRPVSAIDAYGKDIDPRGAWYDEMLISGNTIVVIGYS